MLIPEARTYLRCLEQDRYTYKQEIGHVYTRVNSFSHPFQYISVDPLGPIEVKKPEAERPPH